MDEAFVIRLELKVDKLTEAVQALIRLEERQMTHGSRISALEDRATAVEVGARGAERKIDQWINRGIGVWALALVLWTVFQLAIRR